jgi:hypothetical protein
MSDEDHPARLREIAGRAKRAATRSLELESKASFRKIAERLSVIADEIEQKSDARGGGGSTAKPTRL